MSGAPQIPLIDIAPLLSGDPAGQSEVAGHIGRACREIGFFYVTGHGVAPGIVAGVFDAASRFFAQPRAFKEKAGFTANRGFVGMGGETLDPGKPPDDKEAFNIGLELPADDPDIQAGRPFRACNNWPDMPGFRATMLDYFDRLWRLGRDLHRGFALDLGIDPLFFQNKFDKPMATLRLLHYPPSQGPRLAGQLGAGEHTDYGNVTLLATDEVAGLMVRDRAGRWLDAPYMPGAFICNIGDCLMRWTNDLYVSTPHKVVSPEGRDRYSVAFFLDPDPDALVSCIPACASAERPVRYPPVTAGDFLAARLAPTYAHEGGAGSKAAPPA